MLSVVARDKQQYQTQVAQRRKSALRAGPSFAAVRRSGGRISLWLCRRRHIGSESWAANPITADLSRSLERGTCIRANVESW